jgi:uncharacterized protein YdiU (UPF0061 family)
MVKPIRFNNLYASLGEEFFVRTSPEKVPQPELIRFNHDLASELSISDTELSSAAVSILSGNHVPEGAEPIAMAYAGHQFGQFNPQLGDGRAILLGEIDKPDGQSIGIHLKGSGRTTFSRGGDGKAALGPVLREYLLSEAMHKLGVPTTRALAAVKTGEEVARQQLLPGGVITRVASSFVRVGTFQYFAARENTQAIKELADFVMASNYPSAKEDENPYIKLLSQIIQRQAVLIAQWMNIGFIHGVMNTDNMSLAGETIDYGPCAFMDYFDFDQVYSSIDRNGRYAYSNQPSIALWNLSRLAETMLPLFAEETDEAVEIAKEILTPFASIYQQNWLDGMRLKTGMTTDEEDDHALFDDLLKIMDDQKADFTLTFYYLSRSITEPDNFESKLNDLFHGSAKLSGWLTRWRERLSHEDMEDNARQEQMLATNPVYIPRNHQIEAAIRAAEDNDDLSVFHDLHEVLQSPFVLQEGKERYMLPPEPYEVVEQTFCGT